MSGRLQALGNGRFSVSGDLNFASVTSLYQTAKPLFAEATDLAVDLAAVERSDSSGVALLVDWLRQAQNNGQTIRFINIPAQMRAIIRVADLTAILPITDQTG